MENYTKGESRTVYDPPKLQMDGAVEMKVTNGSKIRNIMGFALSSMTVRLRTLKKNRLNIFISLHHFFCVEGY